MVLMDHITTIVWDPVGILNNHYLEGIWLNGNGIRVQQYEKKIIISTKNVTRKYRQHFLGVVVAHLLALSPHRRRGFIVQPSTVLQPSTHNLNVPLVVLPISSKCFSIQLQCRQAL